MNAPKLTNDILNNGEVKVFLNLGSTAAPNVVPLPLDALLFQVIISPIYRLGAIDLIASDNVSTRTNSSGQKQLQYRYVLIPGGTAARTSIDWNDYAQVKAYLNLKD